MQLTRAFIWHNRAKEEWDRRAASWSEKSEALWNQGSRKDITTFFRKHVKQGNKVIDVGCGDGYGTTQLFKAGYNVVGVDLSEEMIRYATKQSKREEINFKQGDVCDLPFEDGEYDGVLAVNVLEWTEDPTKGLLEIRRVLNDDGLLCIGLLGPTAAPRNNSYERLYGKKAICNTMMPWEFERFSLENGFELVDGFGVYKEGVNENHYKDLSSELKQALTFMWVFMLRKVGE